MKILYLEKQEQDWKKQCKVDEKFWRRRYRGFDELVLIEGTMNKYQYVSNINAQLQHMLKNMG